MTAAVATLDRWPAVRAVLALATLVAGGLVLSSAWALLGPISAARGVLDAGVDRHRRRAVPGRCDAGAGAARAGHLGRAHASEAEGVSLGLLYALLLKATLTSFSGLGGLPQLREDFVVTRRPSPTTS